MAGLRFTGTLSDSKYLLINIPTGLHIDTLIRFIS